jgi:integrase
MSSRQLRGGIWWYSGYFNGDRIRVSLETSSVAVAKERQAQKDIELRSASSPGKDTPVLLALSRYIEEKKFRRVSSVNADSKRKIEAFLSEHDILRFEDVTVDKMEKHLNAILASGKSEWSAQNSLEYNRIFFKWCADREYIQTNPLKDIPKYKPASATIRYLTGAELRKVLENASVEPLFPAVATAIYTGLRKGEIFNLTPEDIDLRQGIIHVREKEGWRPKGREARAIGINKRLRAVLRKAKPHNGRMFDITNNVRIMRRIVKKAGVPWAGWHTFRHSFASELVKQGVDIYTVSKILGHKSVSITEKTYLHSSPEHQRSAVDRIDF